MEGVLAWLCSWPGGDRSPRHRRMAGAEVLLGSRHQGYCACHRERVGTGSGIGDRDGDVAKEVRASQGSRSLPNNRLSR